MTGKREFVVGVFVGGSGRRMGGIAKGLMRAPDGRVTIIERLLRELRQSALEHAEILLVGERDEYRPLGLPGLADQPPGIGPLGGLMALCRRALERGKGEVVAIACDLPYLTTALIDRLAAHSTEKDAVAARSGAVWQPLFARYRCAPTLAVATPRLARASFALHPILDDLGADVLTLSTAELALLGDWDEPADLVTRSP